MKSKQWYVPNLPNYWPFSFVVKVSEQNRFLEVSCLQAGIRDAGIRLNWQPKSSHKHDGFVYQMIRATKAACYLRPACLPEGKVLLKICYGLILFFTERSIITYHWSQVIIHLTLYDNWNKLKLNLLDVFCHCSIV